jgi:hypothetical protein
MPFKYYIIYMKSLYRQNSHYIGKSTTSRLTYRLVTKSVPCRLDSTYRLENLAVNHNNHNMGYYLADGIYPDWGTLVKTISASLSNKHKLFAEHQETCRKDVERAFGVLQAR